MSKPARPAVFPLFRSKLDGELLTLLFISEKEYSITELTKKTNGSQSEISRTITVFEQAGVVTSKNIGRVKLVSINSKAPFYKALKELVEITLGPQAIISNALAGLKGMNKAYIFGSWAARNQGIPGQMPNDIDVIIIGKVDRDELYDLLDECGEKLGREVNAQVVTLERWEANDGALIQEIKNKAKTALF